MNLDEILTACERVDALLTRLRPEADLADALRATSGALADRLRAIAPDIAQGRPEGTHQRAALRSTGTGGTAA